MDFWRGGDYTRSWGGVNNRAIGGYYQIYRDYITERGELLILSIVNNAGYIVAGTSEYKGRGISIRAQRIRPPCPPYIVPKVIRPVLFSIQVATIDIRPSSLYV